jgi:hypothetical protein
MREGAAGGGGGVSSNGQQKLMKPLDADTSSTDAAVIAAGVDDSVEKDDDSNHQVKDPMQSKIKSEAASDLRCQTPPKPRNNEGNPSRATCVGPESGDKGFGKREDEEAKGTAPPEIGDGLAPVVVAPSVSSSHPIKAGGPVGATRGTSSKESKQQQQRGSTGRGNGGGGGGGDKQHPSSSIARELAALGIGALQEMEGGSSNDDEGPHTTEDKRKKKRKK